jgi:aspartate carbamoyltransferase catalytic subunit
LSGEGDGTHAYPFQALLDMMTVRENKGTLGCFRIAIIAHSRAACSNIEGFTKMGSEAILAGPPAMMPKEVKTLGASVTYDVDETS